MTLTLLGPAALVAIVFDSRGFRPDLLLTVAGILAFHFLTSVFFFCNPIDHYGYFGLFIVIAPVTKYQAD